MMQRTTRALDASISRPSIVPNIRPNYWENEEITSYALHAPKQEGPVNGQSRKRPDFDEKRELHANFQGRHKQAIRTSKRECFKELFAETDQYSWGTA